MKPVKVTERDRFGHGRTSIIRRDGTCGEMSPAEVDPDRIELPIH